MRGHPDKLFVLVGHPDVLFLCCTHSPWKTRWGNTLVINPGSVGLPTDGNPRAAYALWADGEVTFGRAAYDVEKTVQALGPLTVEADLKRQLIERMRTGGRLAPGAALPTSSRRSRLSRPQPIEKQREVPASPLP